MKTRIISKKPGKGVRPAVGEGCDAEGLSLPQQNSPYSDLEICFEKDPVER